MTLVRIHSNSAMWQRGILPGNLFFSIFFMQIWRTTSRSFPIIRSFLGPLDQWPKPLPCYLSALASSHHPITATSHPMAPMRWLVKLHFGSKEGGGSSVLGLRDLLLRFATPGGGWPSPILVIKMHQPHSILVRWWFPPVDHPA